jgi:hypothetical protein
VHALAACAQAVQTLRATQLEAVYGLDCCVPGAAGAARLAAWWSPLRREAMLELRLF